MFLLSSREIAMSTAIRTALAFISTLLLSASAGAQVFRAYLAPGPAGNDANPCTLAQPCRLLPAALTAVQDGGEIWMLDSANYNTASVNITKSVTILAVPGAVGSVVATGGNAININTAGVKVALRNLVLVPLPGAGGFNGISMTDGASLTVEGCLLANLPGTGIFVTGAASVHISDTTIRGNAGSGLYFTNGASATVTRAIVSANGVFGIGVLGDGSSTTMADIADSTLAGNSQGIVVGANTATSTTKVSVRDSRSVKNTANGITAQSIAGGPITLSASNNVVSNNGGYGILSSFPAAKVWASGNTVSGNLFGLVNDGATFETAGDNAVRNNVTADTSGTITVITTK
jgi:hypothetical protein